MAGGPGITPSVIPTGEGTRASNTDMKANDLTGQASLWAGPFHPSIEHCDSLILIFSFPILCALSLALKKTTAAT